jgi:hypothetical protein
MNLLIGMGLGAAQSSETLVSNNHITWHDPENQKFHMALILKTNSDHLVGNLEQCQAVHPMNITALCLPASLINH